MKAMLRKLLREPKAQGEQIQVFKWYNGKQEATLPIFDIGLLCVVKLTPGDFPAWRENELSPIDNTNWYVSSYLRFAQTAILTRSYIMRLIMTSRLVIFWF